MSHVACWSTGCVTCAPDRVALGWTGWRVIATLPPPESTPESAQAYLFLFLFLFLFRVIATLPAGPELALARCLLDRDGSGRVTLSDLREAGEVVRRGGGHGHGS
jgi:hypothetical protein